MNRILPDLRITILPLVAVAVSCAAPIWAQEFRDPGLQNDGNLSQAFDLIDEKINRSAGETQQLKSVVQRPEIIDGFVPAAKTRLQPVNPPGANSQQPIGESTTGMGTVLSPDQSRQRSFRPGIGGDIESGLQPIIPGRTDLRSAIENLDSWAEEEQQSTDGPEVIWQNYPDGTPQLMRHVAQDEAGNYYNHGDWKLFNRERQILAQGQFHEGVMDGVWKRWHPQSPGGLFSTKPFNLFRGPFLSTASFNQGELDGVWTLHDHFERKIFEIPYRNGVRNGKATWLYPSSMPMREVTFKDGLIDGALLEWDEQNKLIRQDEYITGNKIIRQTSFYRAKYKEFENYFLDAKLEPVGSDNWWEAKPAGFKTSGMKLQHGPALSWYANGQPKMKGQYKDDLRYGRFMWWHPNGQKQLTGTYDENGLKIGLWTWWHANGIKAIEGQYKDDIPAEEWRWWDENGQVESNENLSERAIKTNNSDTEIEIGEVPTIKEGEAEFRDPNSTQLDQEAEVIPIIQTPESTKMEEIRPFGEGEVDILPEKIVPDDNN